MSRLRSKFSTGECLALGCGKRGQAALDYAIFTAVVAAALIGMQVYIRRSIQGNLKTLEDQVTAEPTESPVVPATGVQPPTFPTIPTPPQPPPALSSISGGFVQPPVFTPPSGGDGTSGPGGDF